MTYSYLSVPNSVHFIWNCIKIPFHANVALKNNLLKLDVVLDQHILNFSQRNDRNISIANRSSALTFIDLHIHTYSLTGNDHVYNNIQCLNWNFIALKIETVSIENMNLVMTKAVYAICKQQTRSLISTFIVRWLDSIMPIDAISKYLRH